MLLKRTYSLGILMIVCTHFSPAAQTAQKVNKLVTIGGGLFDCLREQNRGVAQAELRFAKHLLGYLRPQATLILPEFKGLFFGAGLGFEFYVNRHLVITPSFEPGLYYRGRAKNLGHFVEFRTCIDMAYEGNAGWRLGVQFYHLSHAHLGKHNPGAEVALIYIGIPISL